MSDESENQMRRLLIVTTRFYPDPVVGGVRMTQWSSHLPKYGWKPYVLTKDFGYRVSSEELREVTHPAVELDYVSGSPLYFSGSPLGESASRDDGLHARLTRAVKTIAVEAFPYVPVMGPDMSILFWRSARKELTRAVECVRPDAILTTSPPHSIHDAGLWLQERFPEIPWIADFRDPYLIDDRYTPKGLGRLRWRSHQRFEEAIYERASLIIHTIAVHHRFSRMRYANRREAMLYLPNGCPQRLLEGELEPVESPGGRFSVRVVGSAGSDEALRLARAVRILIDEGWDLELRIVGSPPDSQEEIRAVLHDRVSITGPVQHELALREIAGGDVLASLTAPERSRGMGVSSKLFEFGAVPCPKLLVNPTTADRHRFSDWPGLWFLPEPSVSELLSALGEALSEREKVRKQHDSWLPKFADRFSRRSQTARLAGRLDDLAPDESG